MSIAGSVSSHSFITSIVNSVGVHYDRLLDVKFNNDYWNIVTHIDISNIQPHLDVVDKLFDKVQSFCKNSASSKIQVECLNSVSSLQNQHLNNIKKFSSVSYLIFGDQPKRTKRGLIDAGGSILKSLFGTLDNDDAIKYSEAIDKVQSDEKQLAHLMRDNIHVIRSTISTFNSSISKLNENENRLNQNLLSINKAFELISNSNDKLEIKSQLNLLLNSLESIIISTSFDIEDLDNAILFSKLNILHPTVLSPQQLYSELVQHRNNLPSHCELPITPTLHNVHELIDISRLVSYYYKHKVVIILKVPLVLPQTYQLFHIIPLPIPFDVTKPDTYVLVAPTKPYVTITVDRMFYSLHDSVERCKTISEYYVCELNTVSVLSTVANPTCETILLTDKVNKVPKQCDVKLITGHIDVIHKLSGNRWIYVQSEPAKCHVMCDNDPVSYDEVLLGTGFLTVPNKCKAFFKTLQFTPSQTYTSNTTYTLATFNIIQDDCCDKLNVNTSFKTLPLNKLNNINNLDSLMHASTYLENFEKELEKLEKPSHFQRYNVHYMSVGYFISLLTLFYILFKSRKYLCGKQSPCCIQIFNQCGERNIQPHNQIDFKINQALERVIDTDDHFPTSKRNTM